MAALDFFGKAIAFVIGAIIGASVMYFGGLYIEWKEDRKDGRR